MRKPGSLCGNSRVKTSLFFEALIFCLEIEQKPIFLHLGMINNKKPSIFTKNQS